MTAIEIMARAMFAADHARQYERYDAFDDQPKVVRNRFKKLARAALRALTPEAVSDKAMEAFSRVTPAHYFPLSLWTGNYRRAILAALHAMAEE